MEDYPIYNMIVTYEDDKTGIERNSMVKFPAVEISRLAFGKEEDFEGEKKAEFRFSEDASEQLFMSVSCLADTVIPRKSKVTGKRYGVQFSKDVIRISVNKFVKQGRINEVNWQHQNGNDIQGVYLVEHFIQNKDRVSTNLFGDIPEGSWVTTYWVEDKDLYESLKNDPDFNGFSIEINAFLEESFAHQFELIDNEIDIFEQVQSILKDSKLNDEQKYDKIQQISKQL